MAGMLRGYARIAHPQGHGGDHRLFIGRGALAVCGVVGVDDDVDLALPVQNDLARAMSSDGAKPHHLQHLTQGLGLGGGVLDEFDAVHANRVVVGADVFALLGGVVHAGVLSGADSPNWAQRRSCSGVVVGIPKNSR